MNGSALSAKRRKSMSDMDDWTLMNTVYRCARGRTKGFSRGGYDEGNRSLIWSSWWRNRCSWGVYCFKKFFVSSLYQIFLRSFTRTWIPWTSFRHVITMRTSSVTRTRRVGRIQLTLSSQLNSRSWWYLWLWRRINGLDYTLWKKKSSQKRHLFTTYLRSWYFFSAGSSNDNQNKDSHVVSLNIRVFFSFFRSVRSDIRSYLVNRYDEYPSLVAIVIDLIHKRAESYFVFTCPQSQPRRRIISLRIITVFTCTTLSWIA